MSCTVFVYNLDVETGKVSYDRDIPSAHGRWMDAFGLIFLIIPGFPFVLEIIKFKGLFNNGCFQYEDYATDCLKGFLLRVNAARENTVKFIMSSLFYRSLPEPLMTYELHGDFIVPASKYMTVVQIEIF